MMVDKTVLAIDIGSTKTISVVAQKNIHGGINILGVGASASKGVKKGSIVDIDKLSQTVNQSISNATSTMPYSIDEVIVSISSIHTKSIRNSGSINIQNGIITQKEITQVLKIAYYDAEIIPDYDAIHIIPLYFIIDDNLQVENPLNMNGSRLDCYVNIIIAKKTSLNNIAQVLKRNNLEIDNFILSSYASALSTLDSDQKKIGTALIDMGGDTTELILYKNNTINYSIAIPYGSENITKDLHTMFQTPLNSADKIKKEYGFLIDKNIDNKKVIMPHIGNPDNLKEILIEEIKINIHARVEEILTMIYHKFIESGLDEQINALILTGGMSKIEGIDKLANKIFHLPTTIIKPINLQNGYMNLQDQVYATIVGMILYAFDDNPMLELDSNKNLRTKIDQNHITQQEQLQSLELDQINQIKEVPPSPTKKNNVGNSLLKKISKMFGFEI